jgi:hypothetical protein
MDARPSARKLLTFARLRQVITCSGSLIAPDRLRMQERHLDQPLLGRLTPLRSKQGD